MQVDAKTLALYQEKAPALLESVTPDTHDGYRMKRDANNGECVKFSQGLCGIQAEYGEHFLGEACYFYPRVARRLGNHITVTAMLSCPEIARIALYEANDFLADSLLATLPEMAKNYLPESINQVDALAIHQHFITQSMNPDYDAATNLLRCFIVCESLERISLSAWGEAVPFYFEHASAGITMPDAKESDLIFLLQSLCGLVFSAKKLDNTRLMQTIGEMEQALHVTIRRDNLAIDTMPDSLHAAKNLATIWNTKLKSHYHLILSRYLAMQLSLALFPYSGFGETLADRMAIIGIRFAYLKLALASFYQVQGRVSEETETIRIVQSLSRFVDHLDDASFSLNMYHETGWLKKERLMALMI